MQRSSRLWNRERDRDIIFRTVLKNQGGNWLETLAMLKATGTSSWELVSLPSIHNFSKRGNPTVACLNLCFPLFLLLSILLFASDICVSLACIFLHLHWFVWRETESYFLPWPWWCFAEWQYFWLYFLLAGSKSTSSLLPLLFIFAQFDSFPLL